MTSDTTTPTPLAFINELAADLRYDANDIEAARQVIGGSWARQGHQPPSTVVNFIRGQAAKLAAAYLPRGELDRAGRDVDDLTQELVLRGLTAWPKFLARRPDLAQDALSKELRFWLIRAMVNQRCSLERAYA